MNRKKTQPQLRVSQIRPVKVNKTRRAFEAVIGAAPLDSLEVQLFHGRGPEITNQEIEARIEYLKGAGKLSVKAGYKAVVLTFLEEELDRRLTSPDGSPPATRVN